MEQEKNLIWSCSQIYKHVTEINQAELKKVYRTTLVYYTTFLSFFEKEMCFVVSKEIGFKKKGASEYV